MKGTWQTDDHAASGALVLLLIGAAILAGSGAAAAIAATVVIALIAAAAVLVLTVAGLAAYLVYRARRSIPSLEGIIPAPAVHRLPAPERAALEPPAAQELHLHFHGADPAAVAEILHRHQRPE